MAISRPYIFLYEMPYFLTIFLIFGQQLPCTAIFPDTEENHSVKDYFYVFF